MQSLEELEIENKTLRCQVEHLKDDVRSIIHFMHEEDRTRRKFYKWYGKIIREYINGGENEKSRRKTNRVF